MGGEHDVKSTLAVGPLSRHTVEARTLVQERPTIQTVALRLSNFLLEKGILAEIKSDRPGLRACLHGGTD